MFKVFMCMLVDRLYMLPVVMYMSIVRCYKSAELMFMIVAGLCMCIVKTYMAVNAC